MTAKEHMDGFERKWALVDAKNKEIELHRAYVCTHVEAFTRSQLSPEILVELYVKDFRTYLDEIKRLQRERDHIVATDYTEFAEGNELAEVVPIR